MQALQQSLPFTQDQFGQVQQYGDRQQPRPKLHGARHRPPARVEQLVQRRIETPAGGLCHLAHELFVGAVFDHLVFLPVQADLREGARFGLRAHAKQTLVIPDPHTRPVMPGLHLADLQRRLEAVRTECINVRDGGWFVYIASQVIIHY